MIDTTTRAIWAHILTETTKTHVLGCPFCRTLDPCVVGTELVASMATFLDAAAGTSQ